MGKHASSGKYAIVGLGVVAGPQPDRSERMIAAEAARLAIADAGLTRADIGGAIDLRRTGGGGDRASYSDAFTRVLGIKNNFYFTCGRGGALAGLGMAAAMSYLDRGIADYVVLMGAVTDWSQSQETRKKGFRGMAHAEKRGYWGKPLGDSRAVSHHSWMAARHMAVYGTTSAQLGAISVAQREWACMNPEAKMYGRPITIEDHQSSPLVAEPYHLLDMSQVSDGGIAFILTTADRAKDCAKQPVYVLGQGFGEVSADLWWEKKNFTHMAVEPAKKQAFGQADITLDDVDCAQLYDCFTAEVLFQLEDYGWCKKGEGGAFVADGNMAPGGSIPVNTGGGLLSCYHLGDLTGLAESVRQLRGEAGERQIEDCDIVLTTGHGGELVSPGMCSIHTCTLLGRHA
ncbi:thiolase family protein [Sinorhizobium mexicanum]|uniref:Thiolase family protein n=1 Tax=Sinorhizobium mexicanum TaxID=375549 RepID=A0A859QIC6_9HYPH|nr:thiolase family protein [Sinorhizobium mexicanum]MBP1881976.1 acetyl-CoA acetyltransferase [Sinorhizobium mexicanum]QLL61710.1 thiolase family protein [Sinorhizobium mexicanum]